MDKRIFLFGFLLFFFGTANAMQITGDFEISTDCSSVAMPVYVLKNDSAVTQSYTIEAVGENSSWITLNGTKIGEKPYTATLSAGESIELYTFISPQVCYLGPGEYIITIEISNDETVSKEIKVTITESRKVILDVSPLKAEASQCEKTLFEITVENSSLHKETVLLSVEGVPAGWASLSISEMALPKGETKTAKLELQPPCDVETKEYAFAVKAALQETTFSISKNASLKIEDEQQIEITGKALRTCLDGETISLIKIKNSGLLEDELQLSIEDVEWVSVEPAELTLKAEEEADVSLVFSKTDVQPGTYDFTVKAHSEKFNKDSEKRFSVEAQDCYNVAVASVLLNNKEVGEKPTVCIEDSHFYKFTLINDAVEAIEVDVRVSGLDAVISPSTLSIEPKTEKEVSVQFDLSNSQPGEKSFTLLIKAENFSVQHDYQLLALDCYNLQVDWDGLTDQIDLDANCESQPFTVKVKNSGTESHGVEVSVEGPQWVYFEPQQLILDQGEEQHIYFYFAPPYDTKEGKYNAIVSINGKERSYNIRIEANVSSQLPVEPVELLPESVGTKSKVDEVVETVERMAKITLFLSNDGNNILAVNSIWADGNNASFDFVGASLQPGETVEVPMTLMLGPGDQNQFAVTLQIETDRGALERIIEIDLLKEADESEGQQVFVGLFGLAGLGDLLLAAIVIVAIVIFAAIALSLEMGKKSESGLSKLAKEVQELPGKKLEQIGKRRGKKRGRPSSKNLQDIVKQVKKRKVKKPARRRKTRKK